MIRVRTWAFLLLLSFLALWTGCEKDSAPRIQASESTQARATPVDPATAASIRGTVSFTGTPPRQRPIDMSNDPGCKGSAASEQVVVADGRLANVLVYVKDGLNGRAFPPPAERVTIAQRGCRYVPHVAAVMVGQPVTFLDSDDVLHNIHLTSKDNREWNQSQMPNSRPLEKSFEHPELMMSVKCNQHPWMRMYLNVLGNPFFAVTGADGTFSLQGLPPGTYTIAAVHEKYGERDQTVTVGQKQLMDNVNFTYTP